MAVVSGIKEKVHLPIYDSIHVEPEKQLREIETSSKLKFFVNVQGKTRLETNLQAASLLSHYNTFEARAMRIVISDLPPVFPNGESGDAFLTKGEDAEEYPVTDDEGESLEADASVPNLPGQDVLDDLLGDLSLDLATVMDLLKEARESEDKQAVLDIEDEETVTLYSGNTDLTPDEVTAVANAGGVILLSVSDLEALARSLEKKAPPLEQIRFNDGAGNIISKLIYSTVATFYVGEKIMIEMPAWFFPGGAGAYSEGGKVITHGEPSPTATFRFAEPIYIDKQQNFRVELEVPDSDTLKEIQKIYGPLFIWVVLDGYMTRDVQ
jgi:hypothetical protein